MLYGNVGPAALTPSIPQGHKSSPILSGPQGLISISKLALIQCLLSSCGLFGFQFFFFSLYKYTYLFLPGL